jgi:flagellar FliL protein
MSDADSKGSKAKGSGRRRVVLVALPALAAVAAGAGYVLWPAADAGPEQVADVAQAEVEASDPPVEGQPAEDLVVAPFREIIVNISATTASGRQTQRFLKLNLALVYDATADGADRLVERQPFIRDAYIDYLRLLSERDLSGSAGLARLRAELLHRARTLAETDAPREVLVVDLVIQ